MVLLHVLMLLRDEYGLSLTVAHLDHGIRGEESQREGDFVRDLARAMNLPFETAEADVPALAKKQRITLTSPFVEPRKSIPMMRFSSRAAVMTAQRERRCRCLRTRSPNAKLFASNRVRSALRSSPCSTARTAASRVNCA